MELTAIEKSFLISDLEQDRHIYETMMKLHLATKAEIALYQTRIDIINGLLAKLSKMA